MGGKKWGVPQYSTVFVIMAIVCGMGGFKGNFWDRLDLTFKAFTKGMTALTYAAFVIAFSRAISVIMTDGKIIHTVIYYLAMPINQVGNVVGAFLMYVANVIVNFFIGSGSGQAVTVMPIFAPLAHITPRSRSSASSSATVSPTASTPQPAFLWRLWALRASPTASMSSGSCRSSASS